MSSCEDASPSGIKTAEDGARYVGGSVRKDGTVRKVVKVKPGFVPAEDIMRYTPGAFRAQRARLSAKVSQDVKPETKSEATIKSFDKSDIDTKPEEDHERSTKVAAHSKKPESSILSNTSPKKYTDPQAKSDSEHESSVDKLESLMANVKLESSTDTADEKKSVYIPPWKRRAGKATESKATDLSTTDALKEEDL